MARARAALPVEIRPSLRCPRQVSGAPAHRAVPGHRGSWCACALGHLLLPSRPRLPLSLPCRVAGCAAAAAIMRRTCAHPVAALRSCASRPRPSGARKHAVYLHGVGKRRVAGAYAGAVPQAARKSGRKVHAAGDARARGRPPHAAPRVVRCVPVRMFVPDGRTPSPR
jgi:hypothetical protein